ncbi:MAG: DUF4089 domain-containing protein [Proteobacteria bacterium]|nr:DUF4089 domain-containing protein [Pseudomonadota bacterium]
MPTTPDNIADYVDRVAAAVGIPIAPEHRPGVIVNFQRTSEVAKLVTEFALPDEIESPAIFRP